jgi:Fur family ferric uptake transcriptional regulator
VAAALDEVDEFRSAQELNDMLKHKGDSVWLTTVYRRCSTGEHHHHLVCRVCGKVEVEGPAVEKWAEAIAAEHGFVNMAHAVEIFGTDIAGSPWGPCIGGRGLRVAGRTVGAHRDGAPFQLRPRTE